MQSATKRQGKLLLAILVLVIILTGVFIIQNWQPVSINLLGFLIQGRLFMVLIAFFGLGFLSGWLGCYLRKERKRVAKNNKPQPLED
jgi:uncharacterized integral membrane protein